MLQSNFVMKKLFFFIGSFNKQLWKESSSKMGSYYEEKIYWRKRLCPNIGHQIRDSIKLKSLFSYKAKKTSPKREIEFFSYEMRGAFNPSPAQWSAVREARTAFLSQLLFSRRVASSREGSQFPLWAIPLEAFFPTRCIWPTEARKKKSFSERDSTVRQPRAIYNGVTQRYSHWKFITSGFRRRRL